MASMSDDLPAPVGPVIANRSRSRKSTLVGERKLVKPESSSAIAAISGSALRDSSGVVLGESAARSEHVQLAEQCEELRSRVGPMLLLVIGGVELGRIATFEKPLGSRHFLLGSREEDVDRVREQLPHFLGQAGHTPQS